MRAVDHHAGNGASGRGRWIRTGGGEGGEGSKHSQRAARWCDVVPGSRHNKGSCTVATDVLQAIARHIVRVADADGDEDEQVR